ncbi:LOW QUALITY PROTEIN: hypothetical protein TorRG33x02_056480 [Trema orientale]|uniref:Uncharacterized protein n=1 Tax=Trema orientale TaxID=63057 RepID=A0A2P5FKW9_TREOI|nr:LOW QUALITY PROTEIN: hypothetical protein TorRG33x02_056480 [Trema orientale]
MKQKLKEQKEQRKFKTTANTIIKPEHIVCNHQNHKKHLRRTSGQKPESNIHQQLNSSFHRILKQTNNTLRQQGIDTSCIL